MKYLFNFRVISLIITMLCTLQSWGGNDDIVQSTVNYGIDINNKYAYVTGGTGTHLVIDDYYQGYPVREINAFAFQNNNVIKTIQFPNTLKRIGGYAFGECQNLLSILLPDSVEYLGENAFGMSFDNKPSVKTIILPSSLRTIMSGAIECWTTEALMISCKNSNWAQNCLSAGSVEATQLKYIYISSLEDWCSNHLATFEECPLAYSTQEGVIRFNDTEFNGSITIPEDVPYIGEHTFARFQKLKNLIISNNVKDIRNGAFSECENLTSAIIGDSVSIISDNAFEGCKKLYTLNIGKSVKNFSAFTGCTGLKEVTISKDNPYMKVEDNSVLSKDGSKLFYIFQTGKTYKMPESIKTIEEGAFNGCTNLDTLIINDNITKIPKDFLYGNKSIKTVILGNSVKEIGEAAFKETGIKSIILPESVDSIGKESFYDCQKLKCVYLNDKLRYIGDEAFYGCPLDSITIPASVIKMGEYCLFFLRKIRINATTPPQLSVYGLTYDSPLVIVPRGCKEVYKQAYKWSDYTIIENELHLNISKAKEEKLKDILLPYKDSYEEITGITLNGNISGDDFNFLKDNLQNLCDIDFCNTDMEEFDSEYLEGYNFLNHIELGKKLRTLHLSNLYVGNSITIPNMVEYVNLNNVRSSIIFTSIIPPHGTVYDIRTDISVPGISLDLYKKFLSNQYTKDLKIIENYNPEVLNIYDTLNISDLNFDSKPLLYIHGNGHLSITGEKGNEFSQIKIVEHKAKEYYGTDYGSLITNSNITADSTLTNIRFSTGKWTFFSLPYDVKVSDIVLPEKETYWSIRKYNGKNRAEAKFDSTWQEMTQDSILKHNVGYAIHIMNEDNTVVLGFPTYKESLESRNWVNSQNAKIKVYDYTSESLYDQSWNLIGNPYPCYYDTRNMEYKSPITVWSETYQSYQAYSPIDDAYILSPSEAFFVQKNENVDNIVFDKMGRQHESVAMEKETNGRAKVKEYNNREVFNLMIYDETTSDKTRFVFNPSVKSGYALGYDAAKFESDNPSIVQIYVIDNNLKYAIKERPIENGKVLIGIKIGNAGKYTIHMNTISHRNIYLYDKLNGNTVDISKEDYTFNTQSGIFNDRFVLMPNSETTNIQNDNTLSNITISGNIVTIPSNTTAYIYNTEGAKIYSTINGGTIRLREGMYIINHNGESDKIYIK